MPEPPEGEADLRTLAQRYDSAERQIRELIARAPNGDKPTLLKAALLTLIVVRKLPARGPVVTAYLAEHPFGASSAVDDLAGSLAKHLDDGVRRAQAGSRRAFRMVSEDNVEELSQEAVTAHDGADGRRWSLGHWSSMQVSTLGRQATSRGLANSMGEGGQFAIAGGNKCALCRGLSDGIKTVGKDRLPPFHPGCDCMAVRV